MIFSIDTPKECGYCPFAEELIFCSLLNGKHIKEFSGRPEWCPFDNDGRTITREDVKVVKKGGLISEH